MNYILQATYLGEVLARRTEFPQTLFFKFEKKDKATGKEKFASCQTRRFTLVIGPTFVPVKRWKKRDGMTMGIPYLLGVRTLNRRKASLAPLVVLISAKEHYPNPDLHVQQIIKPKFVLGDCW